jgi:hypothetical protein
MEPTASYWRVEHEGVMKITAFWDTVHGSFVVLETTRRYIPDAYNFHTRPRENLK